MQLIFPKQSSEYEDMNHLLNRHIISYHQDSMKSVHGADFAKNLTAERFTFLVEISK